MTTAGIRLATGNDKNPVSTNTTFGDYFNKSGFLLDQAYLKFTPVKEPHDLGAVAYTNPWFYSDLGMG